MGRAALLLWRLTEGKAAPAVLSERVQKKPFSFSVEKSSLLPRSIPEAEGVDSKYLEWFVQRAAACKSEDLHSMTVLRHGKVILEKSFLPYDREIWHVTHSLCKTVTALAVGICVGDGLLHIEDRVSEFFPGVHTDARYRGLTVFHLLTMTSGASYNEICSVTERDWVRGYLNSQPLFRVGEKFHYNSMNTYMLSAILSVVTGESLSAFLQRRLFTPMGIRQFHWETCPNGVDKGGWGLYLLQEDAAKLGQLILSRGMWNGKQLVTEEYIRDMCLWHSDPPEKLSRNGYGYQCWLWEREGSVRLSGLFGQTVLVVPDKDTVLAINAGSGRIMGEAAYLRDFQELLQNGMHEKPPILSQLPAQPVPQSQKRAQLQLSRLKGSRAYRYNIPQRGVRLLPVFIQLLQNSYTSGIDRISLIREGTGLYMEIEEGKLKNRLEIGFSNPAFGRVTVNRETYLTACSGKWGRKGKLPCLFIRLCFLEQASTRHFEFIFESRDMIRVRLYETPDEKALMEGASLLFDDARLVKRLTEGRFAEKMKTLCAPEVIGIRI